MSGPSMSYLSKMYYFWIFLYQSGEFIIPTSIRLLALDVSWWQTYLIYLSPKCLCKDSINKMHEVLILDVYFHAWA